MRPGRYRRDLPDGRFDRPLNRRQLVPLPVDPFLPEIASALRIHRAAVVVAAPGAGKTTRVPPALLDAGRVLLLQPRRIAARSMARRIAAERGWSAGADVGWQTRYDRQFTAATRLIVATEGILTARLQRDPLLSEFHTVVLDEFHERSIYADLSLALAKQAWLARDDLRLLVMSATLDATAIAAFLNGCPVIDIPGRLHPLTVTYRPGAAAADVIDDALSQTRGDVLCFEPGAREIQRTVQAISLRRSIEVVPLYGALDSADQDRALSPAAPASRRVIVATNIAETSVTVPGVSCVVDTGTHKVARYDSARGVDSLVLERISTDAAAQRAGRAGRLGPGMVFRLWDERDRLRPCREPEIHRIDLAAPALDILIWGGHPASFEWFEAPHRDALTRALELLERLGATAAATLTDIGRAMGQLPLHPRLARMVLAANGSPRMALACAAIQDGGPPPAAMSRSASTVSDLLTMIDDPAGTPVHVRRAAADIEKRAADVVSRSIADRPLTDEAFCRAVLAGYPDRVGQRREPAGVRVKLASGTGAVLAAESGVREGDYLVAVDVRSSGDADARIRIASRVEREWLTPTSRELVHRVNDAGYVQAMELERYEALVLRERPAPVNPETGARLLAAAWLSRGLDRDDEQLVRRARFAGVEFNLENAAYAAAFGVRSIGEIRLVDALAEDVRHRLTRDAPTAVPVPSGRLVPLTYLEDGGVRADVRLQELFGVGDTPRVGPRREPVLLALLAPNGRPVQMTRDLRSFWERTYPEVRKELRGRYPKHPWPQDPWRATPTSRPKRRQ